MYELTVNQMLDDVEYVTKRKLKRSTVEYIDAKNIRRIRFWHTDILTFYPNGKIKITLDGYWTKMTIQRVNQFIGHTCYLHTRNKKRMLFSLTGGGDYMFKEGMMINSAGIPINGEKYEPKKRNLLNSVW